MALHRWWKRTGRTTVMEWERAVRFTDGAQSGVLGPGRYRYSLRRDVFARVDLRPRLLSVAGQDVLSADSLGVKVSALVRWRVTDPVAFATASQAPDSELYAAVQLVLRNVLAESTFDEIVANRGALNEGMADAVSSRLADVGVLVETVDLKDLMLPSEIRHAMAETVLAREQGKAALERARSESASLRSLANTAKLLEEHPALLHLRTLQAADSGSTLVIAPQQR